MERNNACLRKWTVYMTRSMAALPRTERRGYWFNVGKALDALYAKGVPNTEVEEVANLNRVEQSIIKVRTRNHMLVFVGAVVSA